MDRTQGSNFMLALHIHTQNKWAYAILFFNAVRQLKAIRAIQSTIKIIPLISSKYECKYCTWCNFNTDTKQNLLSKHNLSSPFSTSHLILYLQVLTFGGMWKITQKSYLVFSLKKINVSAALCLQKKTNFTFFPPLNII